MLLFGATFFATLTAMKIPQTDPHNTNLNVELTATDDLRLQLTGQNTTGNKLHIKLSRDEATSFGHNMETVFYTERIAADSKGFNRTLNLSQLESGSYELEFRSGKERIVRYFEIGKAVLKEVSPPRVVSLK